MVENTEFIRFENGKIFSNIEFSCVVQSVYLALWQEKIVCEVFSEEQEIMQHIERFFLAFILFNFIYSISG